MSDKKSKFSNTVSILNRNARYEYELMDKFIAGLVLTGTEIKSIRMGKVNLKDAFCTFQQGELFIRQMHISPYNLGTSYNHEETRTRKLLLKRKELKKIEKRKDEKGLTIVPTRLFINDRGFAKVEIALAKGKKLHDKRDRLKQKDLDRELKQIQ